MELRELTKDEENEWNDYVCRSHNSTFYHQIGWKNVVEKTYGHKSYYLIAKENDAIRGILPLFLMKNIFFGTKFISVPFGPYGGVCADDNIIENALINEAKKLTKSYGASYLELRSIPFEENLNSIKKPPQVTSILHLDSDINIIWDRMKRDKKRGINKAKKANVEIIFSKEKINEFYNLYSQTMWYLGAPAHSKDFFKNILLYFPDNTNIVLARYKDKIVSCIFLLFFKNTAISGWSASDRMFLKFYPTDLSYWEIIKYSCEKGYKIFDFGRSMFNSGVHEFKTSFGAETKYLGYKYYLNSINEIPNNTTSNTKRQKFAQLWRKIPKKLTDLMGPLLRSNFP